MFKIIILNNYTNKYWNLLMFTTRLKPLSLLLCLCILLQVLFAFTYKIEDPNARLQQKMNKAISDLFNAKEIKLEQVSVPKDIQKEMNFQAETDFIYGIKIDDKLEAFAYLGQANSMKDVFDYLVILNTDLNILKSKVLIYREQHGRQIGSQRWLKQFIGMDTSSQPKLGENIQGISGATISARSMTQATHQVLNNLGYLAEHKLLLNE